MSHLAPHSPGSWLQVLAYLHWAAGTYLYREPLGDIAARRLVGAVPDHGERAAAFWFMTAAPVLWVGGRLLRASESARDADAQRAAGVVLTASGLVGAAAMPASGFWGIAAVGLAALRRSRRDREGLLDAETRGRVWP